MTTGLHRQVSLKLAAIVREGASRWRLSRLQDHPRNTLGPGSVSPAKSRLVSPTRNSFLVWLQDRQGENALAYRYFTHFLGIKGAGHGQILADAESPEPGACE